ncbi:MAG: energy transducer TonB [Bacteroidales bacterium]|nr:energy transducer TonB [Bacteroidales bacterium]
MKKTILLLFILILGLSNSFAQGNKAFFNRALKEKERLKYKENNIRGYVDYTYNYNEGQKDDSVRHYKIVKIDTSGNVIMIADFDQNRKFETLKKFIFNDKNEVVISFYIEEGRLKYKTNHYYDLNHELIESIITTEFGSVHKKTYYYYSRNRITHFKTVGPSGNIISEGKPKYNENKLPRECKTYKGSSLITEYQFKYNNNLIIEESYSEPDVELQTNFQYFYNNDMIDSSFLKLNSVESFNKRKYFTFGQKKRNIEKWLVIPDFNKYYKVDNNYTQKFVYETPPQFPGGMQALIKYIDENLKYPKKAMKTGIEGLVIVSFVIDATGTTGNIRVNKGIDYEMDNAAINLVKKMPKWKPALNSNGKETMSSFELPVNFVIE